MKGIARGVWGAIVGCALGVVGCASADADVGSAGADLTEGSSGARLLALGDSIAYGWHPEWEPQQPGLPRNPANLQKAVLGNGYPEIVGKRLGLAVDNASCPGEASGSFFDLNQVDNGCRQKRTEGLKMGLPWGAAKTQLELAISQIRGPNPPQIITLSLGGNDLFLVQHMCKDFILGSSLCIASAALLGTDGAPVLKYGDNIEAILKAFHQAGYRGTVVVDTTYAMDYAGLAEPLVFGAFNAAATDAVDRARPETPGMKIVVADTYAQFKSVASKPEFQRNACKAGLLISTKEGAPILDDKGKPTCDRHPAPAGHEQIAEAILAALR